MYPIKSFRLALASRHLCTQIFRHLQPRGNARMCSLRRSRRAQPLNSLSITDDCNKDSCRPPQENGGTGEERTGQGELKGASRRGRQEQRRRLVPSTKGPPRPHVQGRCVHVSSHSAADGDCCRGDPATTCKTISASRALAEREVINGPAFVG